MGAVPLRLARIKKHRSHKSFGANVFMHSHTLRRESRQKETEPNILTRCVGQKPILSAKPSPLPRVTALPRRRKEHTPYSAVSASGIHTPFLCTRAKVPVRALFLYAIFILYNYEPFRRICQAVHTKKAKAKTPLLRCSKFPSKPLPFHQNML